MTGKDLFEFNEKGLAKKIKVEPSQDVGNLENNLLKTLRTEEGDFGFHAEEADHADEATHAEEAEHAKSGGTITGITMYGIPLTPVNGIVEINPTKTTLDPVAIPGASYYLGEQTSISIVMPDNAIVGQEITISFSSGDVPCEITCNLDGFSFVPEANKTNKLLFTLIHKAKETIPDDTDVWTMESKVS